MVPEDKTPGRFGCKGTSQHKVVCGERGGKQEGGTAENVSATKEEKIVLSKE